MSRSTRRVGAAATAAAVAAILTAGCAPMGPTAPWAAAGCYDSPGSETPDLRFSGSENVRGNLTVSLDLATFTLADDGTCAGVPLGAPNSLTLVRADDQQAAVDRCATLGLDNGVGQIRAEYPGFPADAWVCNPAPLDAG